MHLCQRHHIGFVQIALLPMPDGLGDGFVVQQYIVFEVQVKAAQIQIRGADQADRAVQAQGLGMQQAGAEFVDMDASAQQPPVVAATDCADDP